MKKLADDKERIQRARKITRLARVLLVEESFSGPARTCVEDGDLDRLLKTNIETKLRAIIRQSRSAWQAIEVKTQGEPDVIVVLGASEKIFQNLIYPHVRDGWSSNAREVHRKPYYINVDFGCDDSLVPFYEVTFYEEGIVTSRNRISSVAELTAFLGDKGVGYQSKALLLAWDLNSLLPSAPLAEQLVLPVGLVTEQPENCFPGSLSTPEQLLSAWYSIYTLVASLFSESILVAGEFHNVKPELAQEEESSERVADLFDCQSLLGNIISAEAQIVLAGMAGFLCNQSPLRYPQRSRVCRKTISCYNKRSYRIRYASADDLNRLFELENLCWKHTRSSFELLKARIDHYPQGQFVLENHQGLICGVVYSQRLASVDIIYTKNAYNIAEAHEATGSIIQLLALNVDPYMQDLGYGDQLLEFMLQRCSLVAGVTKVIGITLCKHFGLKDAKNFDDYIKLQGLHQDPVLAFHQAHGARVVGAVANYRPEDTDNLYNGVLVEYDIQARFIEQPESNNSSNSPEKKSEDTISSRVKFQVAELLGTDQANIDENFPLMEMGLDSADFLKLQRCIEAEMQLSLKIGFFFENNTIARIVKALALLSQSPAAIAPNSNVRKQSDVDPSANVLTDQNASDKDIAIIGVSCRLPGTVETLEDFWELLAGQENAIRPYPQSRGAWLDESLYPGINKGGFVSDLELFDANFFRITPTEAVIADPQQRILMELSWTCLENANIVPAQLAGTNTGVFIGASNCDYSRLLQDTGVEARAHHATGSSLALLANRISYFFDFSGPSILIDTACSSSLVALHNAVRSLREDDCDQALVGGVNVICHADLSLAYYKAGMLSPDALCKTFDESANGYVRSEGAVMLLLKPLTKALRDENSIYAVIKGSAINHGGLASGLTVPNPGKQKELLLQAWKDAGVLSSQIQYLEAHGTGTSLGDPIELEAIKNAYMHAGGGIKCAVGSVKSNLGHLEAAAGLAGVLKVLTAIKKAQIPASINIRKLNTKIDLYGTSLEVARYSSSWETGKRKIAGISSFGSGGTNAHVVLADWPVTASRMNLARAEIFVISAKSLTSLKRYAEVFLKWVDKNSDFDDFSNVIYTLQCARTHMQLRLAIIASDFTELCSRLNTWLSQPNNHHEGIYFACAQPGVSGPNEPHMSNSSLNDKVWLGDVAEFWSAGGDIDFSKLHEEKLQLLTLPTYIFDRKRYWVDKAKAEAIDAQKYYLGDEIVGQSGKTYFKKWRSLPEHLVYRQNHFACLSIGYIIAVAFSACRDRLLEEQYLQIENLAFYPSDISALAFLSIKTLVYTRGNTLTVEMWDVSEEHEIVVARAEMRFFPAHEGQPLSQEQQLQTIVLYGNNSEAPAQVPLVELNELFPWLIEPIPSRAVKLPPIRIFSRKKAVDLVEIAMADFNSVAITNIFSKRKALQV